MVINRLLRDIKQIKLKIKRIQQELEEARSKGVQISIIILINNPINPNNFSERKERERER